MDVKRYGAVGAALSCGVIAVPWILAANPAHGASPTLLGTVVVTAGTCSGTVSGSTFRMILPSGGPDGPFVSNADSPCADQTYSPLLPGTDGGLALGAYQPAGNPPFDGGGNGTAGRITRPTPFFGVNFAVSTEQVDPQTAHSTPPPSLTVDASGHLSGVLSSFGAWWNKQSFNQGSPKPNGSFPGNSSKVSGTYDAATGAISVTWLSQIVGGSFNNFTGVWHLVGVLRAAGGATPTATPAPSGAATPTASASKPGARAAPAATSSAGQSAPASGGGPQPAAASGTSGGPAAPAAQAGAAVTQTATSSSGWRPATWLVALVAIAGLANAAILVWLGRGGPPANTAS